jgi:hypothetical protein
VAVAPVTNNEGETSELMKAREGGERSKQRQTKAKKEKHKFKSG